MEIGIVGLPQTGKKTFFNLLTYSKDKKAVISTKKGFQIGESIVRDNRFYELVKLYQPKSAVPAKINYMLLPSIQKDSQANKTLLDGLNDVDVICHVVRAFDDPSVFHVEATIDPLRDIRAVNSELLLKDLLFIEKRLDKLHKELKSGKDVLKEKEKNLLERMGKVLGDEKFLNTMEFTDEEVKILANVQLVTLKKQLIILNINDDKISDTTLVDKIKKELSNPNIFFLQISAKAEMEIVQFESESEKKEFLDALGITESAINALTRLSYEALGLITFFTVGTDEVRMWSIPKNSPAPKAARAIHTDLERGFIRAEIIKYDDLIRLGSEEAVKAAGLLMLKGKDYIVDDGDIVHVRFSV